ncbi:hypothetical protein J6590_075980 [Homalodisca vitripennis]|nr:hypothetical protein J6590_075980 [Homalodisca vitripennis]
MLNVFVGNEECQRSGVVDMVIPINPRIGYTSVKMEEILLCNVHPRDLTYNWSWVFQTTRPQRTAAEPFDIDSNSPPSYVRHLKSETVVDLIPEIWINVRLKGSKNSRCITECTMLTDTILKHGGATESSTRIAPIVRRVYKLTLCIVKRHCLIRCITECTMLTDTILKHGGATESSTRIAPIVKRHCLIRCITECTMLTDTILKHGGATESSTRIAPIVKRHCLIRCITECTMLTDTILKHGGATESSTRIAPIVKRHCLIRCITECTMLTDTILKHGGATESSTRIAPIVKRHCLIRCITECTMLTDTILKHGGATESSTRIAPIVKRHCLIRCITECTMLTDTILKHGGATESSTRIAPIVRRVYKFKIRKSLHRLRPDSRNALYVVLKSYVCYTYSRSSSSHSVGQERRRGLSSLLTVSKSLEEFTIQDESLVHPSYCVTFYTSTLSATLTFKSIPLQINISDYLESKS